MHPEIKVWLKDIQLSINEIHDFLSAPRNFVLFQKDLKTLVISQFSKRKFRNFLNNSKTILSPTYAMSSPNALATVALAKVASEGSPYSLDGLLSTNTANAAVWHLR
jgi:hypothetical protein